MAHRERNERDEGSGKPGEIWEFRLYVAGLTDRAMRAFQNLSDICNAYLPGQCRIEVIDLSKSPERAIGDQIVALPTLVKRLPPPVRKVIGDLSNTQAVLIRIDLKTGS